MHSSINTKSAHYGLIVFAASAAAMLSACGGGSGSGTSNGQATTQVQLSTAAENTSSGTTITDASLPTVANDLLAQPVFHLAPVVLDAPDDRDMLDNNASARVLPHVQAVPSVMATLDTRRLTLQSIQYATRARALSAPIGEGVSPAAASSAVVTFTPAQIRAAYGLPALPASGTTYTAAQAAQLGAGQTIYIVNAMHDPNLVAELAVFNKQFGLPSCTSKPIGASATLPLAAAVISDGCVLSTAYSTTTGALSGAAPAYDSGWATEITLDVQWAHATAPLARLVLIEAPDASVNSLLAAIKLANSMGPGVVSMSFGAGEGSWMSSVDSLFAAPTMSYVAATGDNGAAVSWPSASANVLAVGGTSLTYSGSGARTEVVWSGTGGGISAYVATPAYQSNAVPGVGSLAHRSVADVAFNADPSTGQFVSVIPQGSTAASWMSAGGTSLSAPQWAGLVAVANAMRVQAGKSVMGAPHSILYSQVAAVPGNYASAFADITRGSDGACTICTAKTGYDQPTGLGTPNSTGLLAVLTGASLPIAPPTVASATVSGKVGTALSFSVSVTAANPVSYSLSGAPVGMTISTAGLVSWPTPVAGTYAVTVIAKDSKTTLSGQGVYTVSIASPVLPPVIKASALTGVAGKALTGSFTVSDPNGYAMVISITGIPMGIVFSVSGQTISLNWAKPVTGNYLLSVTAKDAAGLSSQASIPITITAH